jgi:hypothetical protein
MRYRNRLSDGLRLELNERTGRRNLVRLRIDRALYCERHMRHVEGALVINDYVSAFDYPFTVFLDYLKEFAVRINLARLFEGVAVGRLDHFYIAFARLKLVHSMNDERGNLVGQFHRALRCSRTDRAIDHHVADTLMDI